MKKMMSQITPKPMLDNKILLKLENVSYQIPTIVKAVTLKIVFVKLEPVDIQSREVHPEVHR